MKMSICLLVILFGVAAAAKPAPRYGEPKPVTTYKARPVETYRPQAHHPVVYQIAPHHGGKLAKTGGKLAKTGGKLATIAAKMAPSKKVIPFALGAKAGVAKAVLLGWG